ncbi:hypothetical protein LINPERHAP2_LOCUS22948 [Linum perenne]
MVRRSPAFFQYIGLPCICFLCGWLGHVMAGCPRTDLTFDEDVRSDWICGKADQNEKESQGPQLQPLPFDRQRGGARGQFGRGARGPRPFLALPGPRPILNLGPGRFPRGSGTPSTRPHFVRPLQILGPGSSGSSGAQGGLGSSNAAGAQAQSQAQSAASSVASGRDMGCQQAFSSFQPPTVQHGTRSVQQFQGQRRVVTTSGPAGPNRASSAPLLPQTSFSICVDPQVESRLGPQATPQSKPFVSPSPSRRSTP